MTILEIDSFFKRKGYTLVEELSVAIVYSDSGQGLGVTGAIPLDPKAISNTEISTDWFFERMAERPKGSQILHKRLL